MPGLTPSWAAAETHADLGLPVGPGRFRSVRRLLGRLLWPVLRHQVQVNRCLLAELDAVRARLDADLVHLARVDGDLAHHSSVLVRHEEPLDRHEFLLTHLERATGDLIRQIDLVQDKVDLGQRQALARYHDGIGRLRSALDELELRLDELESSVPTVRDAALAGASARALEAVAAATDLAAETAAAAARESLESAVAAAVGVAHDVARDAAREAVEEAAGHKDAWRAALDDVWLRMGQLDLFLAEARRSFPGAPPPEQLASLPSGFESLEAVFAEAFRGPAPVVRERVRPYLEDLAGLGGPVLDIGCGRGELLDILAAGGVQAYGIELNAEHVAHCTARGLDVRGEGARAHLAGLSPASLGAVTAIQVVEHLATDELIEIIELAAQAIRPGGVILLETQNPENIVVGASSFYLDPTHRRPIPPALLAFLVGARGFGAVEVRRLERAEQTQGLERPKPDEPWAEAVGALVDVVNVHLFSPADYVVVGRRP
ncbi:MAG: class I SAM-dependent methyltransferase [Acidimicrobiales bacterium]